MASTYDKKFKTTETTKAAGAEVVSDPIELSPRTKNHVLTVTTDNSLSGNVDVEVEMSPDGKNWCAAVSKGLTTEAGTSTDEIIGNTAYVKLTPDAGEFKNKHARGLMNYDLSTDQLYTGSESSEELRTDAADFMQHRIAVNKSFNYSQWLKTSEQPTATYKPVLFRHGGHDPFENTKTIELNSDGATNLKALSLPYGNNVFGNDTIVNDATKAAKSPFYTSTNTNTMPDPSEGYAISLWFKADTVNNSGFRFRKLFKINFTNGGYFAVTWINNGSSTARYIRVYLNDGVNALQYTTYLATSAANSGWNHLVLNLHMSGATNVNFGYDFRPYLNGSVLSNTQYTTGTTYTDATNFTVDNVEINSKWSPSFDDLRDDVYVDEIGFFKGTVAPSTGVGTFDTTYITSLYNNRHDITQASLPTGTELTTLLRCGDGAADVTTTDSEKIVNVLTTVNDFTLIKGSPTAGYESRIINLSSSDAPYVGKETKNLCEPATLPLASSFTTTSDLSISGWFKTTDTGRLFSNTGSPSYATSGMQLDLLSTQMLLYLSDGVSTEFVSASITNLNDGEWHHVCVVKPSGLTPTILIYIDGVQRVTSPSATGVINDSYLQGSNGFTLLSDGQNNANATSPAATDTSKLNATLSNWSIHSEALSAEAISHLYSNGHVRNAMNLGSIDSTKVEAFWQLNDTTNPENDLSGNNYHLQYQDGNSNTLVSQQIDADGATLVQDTLNGNAMTLSLTKSFDFVSESWVEDASGEAAICLSFNGFEDQAEYFALWKCSQTVSGTSIDVCDGNWHNIILSYRGNNDLEGNNVQEGDSVLFGPGPNNTLDFNWALSLDGLPLVGLNNGVGVDFLGGLNTLSTGTYNTVTYNTGFDIWNRHLKYVGSSEEVYKPHVQFSAGIHDAAGVDNNNAFQGSVDETSFHSDCWWTDSTGNSINASTYNSAKASTIYGETQSLSNRGIGSDYPVGVPYPLNRPDLIGAIEGVSNQYIRPDKYDPITNPKGGLEAWWRWGDTSGDCEITINDVKDSADSTEGNAINDHDLKAMYVTVFDKIDMSAQQTPESIYNADVAGVTTPGTSTITIENVKIEGIQSGLNLKYINLPLLEFVRIKWKGDGSIDLGEGKGEAKLCYTNRVRRRQK